MLLILSEWLDFLKIYPSKISYLSSCGLNTMIKWFLRRNDDPHLFYEKKKKVGGGDGGGVAEQE